MYDLANCQRNETHIDALSVLQTVLEHPKNGIRLKIHDKVGTAGKDTERAVAGGDGCSFTREKGLIL